MSNAGRDENNKERERERAHTGGNEVQIVVCVSGIETSIEV
jgi:hypothetical protein